MLKILSTQELSQQRNVVNRQLRHRLLMGGTRDFTDLELLALVLGNRINCKKGLTKAKFLLNQCENNLNDLSKYDFVELMRIKGITQSDAMLLTGMFELSRRKELFVNSSPKIIKSANDAFSILHEKFIDLDHEEFHIIYLNRANSVIVTDQHSSGGLTGTVVDIRLVLKRALLLKSSSFILSHNHPSGNLKPSTEDLHLTEKIVKAAKLMDIKVLDHIIISGHRFFSFLEEGYL